MRLLVTLDWELSIIRTINNRGSEPHNRNLCNFANYRGEHGTNDPIDKLNEDKCPNKDVLLTKCASFLLPA